MKVERVVIEQAEPHKAHDDLIAVLTHEARQCIQILEQLQPVL